MKTVSLTVVVTLCLAASILQTLAEQSQQDGDCSKKSSLVYQEAGWYSVSV